MNEQQPQVQPDFGYIMNQPGAPSDKSQHGRNTKFVILLVVLGVLMAIGLTVAIVYQVTNKVSNGSLTKEQTIQLQVQRYFGYISNNQTAEAYALLSDGAKQQISEDGFYGDVVQVINGNIDLTKCSFPNSSAAGDNQSVTIKYLCDTKDGKYKVYFTVKMSLVDNEYKIDAYQIDAETGA